MAQPPYTHSDRDGAIPIRAEVKKIITDRSQSGVTYVCRALNLTASENDPVWQISREAISGNISTLVYASKDFNQIAADRYTLFPAILGFLNERSVRFDGINDFVNCGNNLSWDYTQAFSISVWVNFANIGSTYSIIAKRQTGASQRGYNIRRMASGAIQFNLVNTVSTNELVVETTSTVTNNVWYHICVTYNGSGASSGVNIYVNGVAQGITTLASPVTAVTTSAASLEFGRWSAYFQGKLDEVSFWDKALSGPEVAAMYNLGKPTDLFVHSAAANLRAWWRMGDAEDIYPVLFDQVGGIVGTMTNMTSSDIVAEVP